MSAECPIAYDHTDDLDECMVCGWTEFPERQQPQPSAPVTGPERIQEAIKKLSGGYAPTSRITICGGGDTA